MSGEVWGAFQHDPRVAANRVLRASDADREIVTGVLTSAYGDGRIDREELDERLETAAAARTLGELPPLVADLVPDQATLVRRPVDPLVSATPSELDAMAVEAWRTRRRSASFGFLGPTLICWTVYACVMWGEFPWPLIVTVVTGLNLLRTLTSRQEILREERRRLEKQQAKALRKRSWRP